MLGLLLKRNYVKESYPIDTLLCDLSRRVSYLEDQLKHLRASHKQLIQLQTILQMGEHFRQLRIHLTRIKDDRKLKQIFKKYQLSENEVKLISGLAKERNEVAHPVGIPDLTEQRQEVTKLFVKVDRILKQIK